ncbi:MAG: glutathione peroxidase [Methylotenera sp.]|nr:glutathione peroxidase [Methylotenera sp.]MDO9233562.1 glutathione peroxidase [Methylotenera sp.]MDO9388814.1 glutathione peroxidase [Methylotenera sp.]MDP2103135.1 glutathione peroxidase [Methylotenera sp.]MDP2281959.1 glutathione peroxidase [Methylotenera sp.]
MRLFQGASTLNKKLIFSIILLSVSNMANAACSALYNHQFLTLQGEKINLCDYQNKPILVVNTASKCGFTPQFEALEGLYKKYKDQGLLVIGFPSNDFKQELSDDKQIGDFCKLTYSVKFPMITKTSVTGVNANAFYKQLSAKTGQSPSWNFFKYVVLPSGKDVYAFGSRVKPDAEEIVSKINSSLK